MLPLSDILIATGVDPGPLAIKSALVPFTDVFLVPSEMEYDGYSFAFYTRRFSNDEVVVRQRTVTAEKPLFIRLKTSDLCNRSFGSWVSLLDAGGLAVDADLSSVFDLYVDGQFVEIDLDVIPEIMGPDRASVGFLIEPLGDICPDPDDIGYCEADIDCAEDKWDRPFCVDDTNGDTSRRSHGRLCQVCTPDVELIAEVFSEELQRWIYPSYNEGCSLEYPYCRPGGTSVDRRSYYLNYEYRCTDDPLIGWR